MLKRMLLLSWRIVLSGFVGVLAFVLVALISGLVGSLLVVYVFKLSENQIAFLAATHVDNARIVAFMIALYAGYRYGWRNKRFIKTPRQSVVDND